ncbi:hypothetical protein DIPPA_16416 [Diplonema papillatum]|nr:hypothetical protein DIPPA_16416 [Diplonema papillatum]|eukprot:gene9579-14867_t
MPLCRATIAGVVLVAGVVPAEAEPWLTVGGTGYDGLLANEAFYYVAFAVLLTLAVCAMVCLASAMRNHPQQPAHENIHAADASSPNGAPARFSDNSARKPLTLTQLANRAAGEGDATDPPMPSSSASTIPSSLPSIPTSMHATIREPPSIPAAQSPMQPVQHSAPASTIGRTRAATLYISSADSSKGPPLMDDGETKGMPYVARPRQRARTMMRGAAGNATGAVGMPYVVRLSRPRGLSARRSPAKRGVGSPATDVTPSCTPTRPDLANEDYMLSYDAPSSQVTVGSIKTPANYPTKESDPLSAAPSSAPPSRPYAARLPSARHRPRAHPAAAAADAGQQPPAARPPPLQSPPATPAPPLAAKQQPGAVPHGHPSSQGRQQYFRPPAEPHRQPAQRPAEQPPTTVARPTSVPAQPAPQLPGRPAAAAAPPGLCYAKPTPCNTPYHALGPEAIALTLSPTAVNTTTPTNVPYSEPLEYDSPLPIYGWTQEGDVIPLE